MRMAKQKSIKRVQAFDLTTPDGRDEYEELVANADTKVTRETEFAMGGTGSVIRVVDFKEVQLDADEFPYEKPIN